MLSDKMTIALNEHMNYEMYSAYHYAAMAAWFEDLGLFGMANWMYIQTQEEMSHAMKFFRYIIDSDARVELLAIGKPPQDWENPKQAFDDVLAHEKIVTKKIHELVDLSLKENDHATHNFLQWFVAEQVEEEAAADDICKQLKFVNGEAGATFLIDRELSKRQVGAEVGIKVDMGQAASVE